MSDLCADIRPGRRVRSVVTSALNVFADADGDMPGGLALEVGSSGSVRVRWDDGTETWVHRTWLDVDEEEDEDENGTGIQGQV